MTSIRSFSEILLGETPVSAEECLRFVAIINEESLRLTRLLDEILDINRLEAGTAALALEPIAVGTAIGAALDAVSGMSRSEGVEVLLEPAPQELHIRANADRLRQVLINVLSNAMKYNVAEEPQIRIRPRAAGTHVWIDVIDNGGGVSRKDATTVFEKFARGSRADHDQGAGLGLPISRAIMRAMGGDLTLEFLPDGTSFFRLDLPQLAPGSGDRSSAVAAQ